jgi:acetoin utilization deacetylase AcuC-like enzyme
MPRCSGAPGRGPPYAGAVRTYFWPAHTAHDPAVLAPPPGSDRTYFSDVAERGRVLLDAVRRAGLGPVQEPSDTDVRTDLLMVHHPALLSFLATAHARHLAGRAGGATGDPIRDVLVPETFAVDVRRPRSGALLAELGWHCFDTSSPLFAGTHTAARGAAACAAAAADDLLAGEPAAYALCRPPGHHAMRERFGGYCYFNNAAVAARRLSAHGRRVAVLDIDAHHGTQDIFWNDPGVFVASVHMDPAVEFPFHWGFEDEVGGPGAEGANLNVPLVPGCDEHRYLIGLDVAVAQVGHFRPDALVVSLGVDAHRDDPVGGFRLDTSSYRRIGERIADLDLPTALVQEGGYHLGTLGDSVLGVLRAFT